MSNEADDRGDQVAAAQDVIGAEDSGEEGGGEPRERDVWLDEGDGLKVKEGSRNWKSPWRFLTGYGWRADIPVRFHCRRCNDCALMLPTEKRGI